VMKRDVDRWASPTADGADAGHDPRERSVGPREGSVAPSPDRWASDGHDGSGEEYGDEGELSRSDVPQPFECRSESMRSPPYVSEISKSWSSASVPTSSQADGGPEHNPLFYGCRGVDNFDRVSTTTLRSPSINLDSN
jgi:hypothetical protein